VSTIVKKSNSVLKETIMIKLFNVSEVASMLGLSTSCVYKKAERGEIQAVKIGTALRFSEEDLQSYLEKCKVSQMSHPSIECNH
jgi:excisionase family DNA binding protein